jgi:large subunit ribosomal protein L24e
MFGRILLEEIVMTKCSFCGKEESPHLGVHLIRNSGHVDFYCSSKCRKNANKLKRDKKKLKWTEAFYAARAQAVQQEKHREESAVKAKHEKVEAEKAKKVKTEKKAATKATKKASKKSE